MTEIKSWWSKTFPVIPDVLARDYRLDTQTVNLRRFVFLSGLFVLVPLILLIVQPSYQGYHVDTLLSNYYLIQSLLLILSALSFGSSIFFIRRITFVAPALTNTVFVIYSFILISWADWMALTVPFSEIRDWFFLGSVFLVYTVLYFQYRELMILSALLVVSQYLMPQIVLHQGVLSFSFRFVYLAILFAAFCISRIIHFARVHNYLNWDNISRINSTLKREVNMHLETTVELEEIRKDLGRKVHLQTKHLKDANQRLSDEVAERRYADKVKGILYRISTFVNANLDLSEVIEFIHQQLSSIMDVTNYFVGLYHEEQDEVEPIFQLNCQEKFVRYSIGNSLSGYAIRKKSSVLLSMKEAKFLAKKGKVELSGLPVTSWLGVPLKVEERVVGILIIQSYDSDLVYDKTDQELLEYVSEHLALAIERNKIESKLIFAKDKAEESDRLKSAFLANLSHEIRTPMNAIVGFSELMGSSKLIEKDRLYYSAQVVENSQFLLTLISNIIELSKIQSGELELMPTVHQVKTTIESLVPYISEKLISFGKGDLFIKTDIDEASSQVEFIADTDRFHQVMDCLLENAIKFTHEGGIELGARVYDGNMLQFSIRDTGIGMDEDETRKIFEWFRQGMKASQDLYRGMGLGLTLAKMLIERMGGTIWVKTQRGSGSCFYFTLPINIEVPTIDINDSHIKPRDSGVNPTSKASAG